MKKVIKSDEPDPLGAMMLDYYSGQKDVFVEVTSTTLDMRKMTGDMMFRSYKEMDHIEKKAIGFCKGDVLDIGAGSGCHSLDLMKRKINVTSIDISPGCVEVMKQRKVLNPIHTNFFSIKNHKYDTLLMLMNGIGICESIDGLNLFFQFIRSILSIHGQVIIDSSDIALLCPPDILFDNDEPTDYYGETQFIMTYNTIEGEPFNWLYIDFDTLNFYADFNGFTCEKIIENKTGKYLARMVMR